MLFRSIALMAFVGPRVIVQRAPETTPLFLLAPPFPTTRSSPSPHSLPRRYARRQPNEDEESDSNNNNTDLLDLITNIISSPSPLVPQVSLGYPLLLAVLGVVLPLSTWILSCGLFAGFMVIGNNVLQQNEDDDDVDDSITSTNNLLSLVSLAGAIASAGLVSPDGLSGEKYGLGGGDVLVRGIGISVVAALAVATLSPREPSQTSSLSGGSSKKEDDAPSKPPSLDEELLKRWDEKFAKDKSRRDKEQ